MLNWLFNLRYGDELRRLRRQNEDLRKSNAELWDKNDELEMRSLSPIRIDYQAEDPEPSNQATRREYVARVAGFYEDTLRDKLYYMISEQQKEYSNPTSSRDIDIYRKGTINAFSLLLDWGDSMVSEHLDNTNNNIDHDETV